MMDLSFLSRNAGVDILSKLLLLGLLAVGCLASQDDVVELQRLLLTGRRSRSRRRLPGTNDTDGTNPAAVVTTDGPTEASPPPLVNLLTRSVAGAGLRDAIDVDASVGASEIINLDDKEPVRARGGQVRWPPSASVITSLKSLTADINDSNRGNPGVSGDGTAGPQQEKIESSALEGVGIMRQRRQSGSDLRDGGSPTHSAKPGLAGVPYVCCICNANFVKTPQSGDGNLESGADAAMADAAATEACYFIDPEGENHICSKCIKINRKALKFKQCGAGAMVLGIIGAIVIPLVVDVSTSVCAQIGLGLCAVVFAIGFMVCVRGNCIQRRVC